MSWKKNSKIQNYRSVVFVWSLLLLFLLLITTVAMTSAYCRPHPQWLLHIEDAKAGKSLNSISTHGCRRTLMRYDIFIYCSFKCQVIAYCSFNDQLALRNIFWWAASLNEKKFSTCVTPTVISSLAQSSRILQVFHWLQLIPMSPPCASKHSTAVFYFRLWYLLLFSLHLAI